MFNIPLPVLVILLSVVLLGAYVLWRRKNSLPPGAESSARALVNEALQKEGVVNYKITGTKRKGGVAVLVYVQVNGLERTYEVDNFGVQLKYQEQPQQNTSE